MARGMYWLKLCSKCQGDMTLERDELGIYLKCIPCGRDIFPPETLAPQDFLTLVTFSEEKANQENSRKPRPHIYTTSRANESIARREKNDRQWWIKNEPAIQLLLEKKSNREVAAETGFDERTIRRIHEKLKDLGRIQPVSPLFS